MKKDLKPIALTPIFAVLLSLSPMSSKAQNPVGTLKAPAAPTPIEYRERTISDLLYYPFSCITTPLTTTKEKAWQVVTDTFGSCEDINGYVGLHANGSFDFTYRDVTIGICYSDWLDDRTFYFFFFNTKNEGERFYNQLVKDVQDAGIPLTRDKIYGGMSNRKRPISIFKWVAVDPPVKVREVSPSNIERADVVGMYKVEFTVMKRKRK